MTDYISALANPASPYHREAKTLASQLFNDDHCYIAQGIVRWNSNDRVPPADVIELAIHLGFGISAAAQDEARAADLATFLKGYNPVVTDEQRAEMRAEFGPGASVVNVLTGRKVAL